MGHEPYIRFLPGSRCAVLMIHGIVGSPAHFDCLMPLVPADWSVYNILLDGHGGTARDFGRTSMKKWKRQVRQMLELLRQRHEKILIVTHSMGGLFALQEAAGDSRGIASLFLLAVPLKPWVSLRGATGAMKAALCRENPQDQATAALRNACSVTLTRNPFAYLPWIPKFAALLWEAERTCRLVERVQVPCRAVQSGKDELVSMRSCRVLKRNPTIAVTVLEQAGHFRFEGAALRKVQQLFLAAVEEMQ